jgi:hypothetical protein
LSTYVIPLTSGGEAAALAAHSTISDRYRFTGKNQGTNLIDIVSTTSARGSSNTHLANSSPGEKQNRLSLDSDENEWVQMSAKDAAEAAEISTTMSVDPQDVIKAEL